jgi:hypothetical protein
MDTLNAIMIIEGQQSETYEDQIIDAWQHLIDSAVVWRLQGSYGRYAQALIENGICSAPEWAEELVPTS